MIRQRKFWGIGLLTVGLLIYFTLDPANSSFFPKCPFLTLTGFQCPGCGSQRAIHQLLHGDVATAFSFNPLFVIALPYIFVLILLEFGQLKKRFAKLHNTLYHYRTINFILIGIISFWILRNL